MQRWQPLRLLSSGKNARPATPLAPGVHKGSELSCGWNPGSIKQSCPSSFLINPGRLPAGRELLDFQSSNTPEMAQRTEEPGREGVRMWRSPPAPDPLPLDSGLPGHPTLPQRSWDPPQGLSLNMEGPWQHPHCTSSSWHWVRPVLAESPGWVPKCL